MTPSGATFCGARLGARDGLPAVLAALLCLLLTPPSVARDTLTEPVFETQVAPILIRHCVECHRGPDPSGGLDLTTREGFRQGGESGNLIDSETPEDSLLLFRISSEEMPPPERGIPRPLTPEEQQLLARWVASGAAWPESETLDYFAHTSDSRAGRDWWSLQPVRQVTPPVDHPGEHPVDAFIRRKLESEQLVPAPQADRSVLIRRLFFDLLGLPPTVSEIQAFVADSRPDAWERLIDDLLARPQYGERWGRHWLDVVRYADTSGYERDQEKPFAWKYRDWVITAFNRDLPYDRFVRAQLAGDEMPERTIDSLTATGFLRVSAWNDEPNDPEDYRYERLEDLVHTTSSAFLGLTVKCARCHAHKFDPIEQEDYYRMAAAFAPGPVAAGRSSDLLGGPSAEELGRSDILGWTDITTTPAPLHLLKNGERNAPLHVVEPGSLSAVPALRTMFPDDVSGNTTKRRLQLADWICHPGNPLTSRVIVNRIWQHHFGVAIVRTPNNFGFLADPPTHPELLDWLAGEFDRGGRRMKSLHRLILTSGTWQQSSQHPDEALLMQKDASNRLLARAERRRLDAESLRDSLLDASGELDLSVGGPGFRPTISPAALEGLSRKEAAWTPSPESAQHRRSVYMFLKRGLLPPMMTAFDFCDPTQSCGQRTSTTVPTQSLALLNNDFVHRRSRHLATSLTEVHRAGSTGTDTDLEQLIRAAWLSVLRRSPTPTETKLAADHLRRQLQTMQTQEASQEQPADGRTDSPRKMTEPEFVFRADEDGAPGQSADSTPGRYYQPVTDSLPQTSGDGFNGAGTLKFDGVDDFLHVDGAILNSQYFTIMAVASDHGGTGHRELISNWNGSLGNSVTSVFLGLTDEGTIRFTDELPQAGTIPPGGRPFLISAVSGPERVSVYLNGRLTGEWSPFSARRLDTDWVIGTQGNIRGEYWNGAIAEIRVFSTPLSDEERSRTESELSSRYGIPSEVEPASAPPDAETAALASLCHVLMNSNEFLYVD